MRTLACFFLLGTCLLAQAPTSPSASDELNAARKKLTDWGGLNVFGSDNSEIPPPKPGENRVVFIGDTLTANWGKGKTPFFPGKPYFNRGIPRCKRLRRCWCASGRMWWLCSRNRHHSGWVE